MILPASGQASCQADSAIRTLDELRIDSVGAEIHLHVAARSFLHHQVRNITGTLALVGAGKWSADDVSTALAARDRSAGPTARRGPVSLSCELCGYQLVLANRHMNPDLNNDEQQQINDE